MTSKQSRTTQRALERALFGPPPKPLTRPRPRVRAVEPVPVPYTGMTCGCPLNLPEADHTVWPCPCGDHCKECNP